MLAVENLMANILNCSKNKLCMKGVAIMIPFAPAAKRDGGRERAGGRGGGGVDASGKETRERR